MILNIDEYNAVNAMIPGLFQFSYKKMTISHLATFFIVSLNFFYLFVLISYMDMRDDTEKLIIATLDKIRYFLQRDGGDVEFVSFENGVVYVRLHGACQDCAFANNDIKDLVEVILQEEVPGVTEVRLYQPDQF